MVILHMKIAVFFAKVYSIYFAWCTRCHGVEGGLSGKSQQYKNGVDRPARLPPHVLALLTVLL